MQLRGLLFCLFFYVGYAAVVGNLRKRGAPPFTVAIVGGSPGGQVNSRVGGADGRGLLDRRGLPQ